MVAGDPFTEIHGCRRSQRRRVVVGGGRGDEHDHRLTEGDEPAEVGVVGGRQTRVSTDMPNRLVSTSGTSSSRPSAASRSMNAARTSAYSARWASVRGSYVATSTASGTARQRSTYPPVARWIWASASARGPRPVLGQPGVEELVGGDVEPSPLQLVEQAVAGAADVGGVAPAHLVARRRGRSPHPRHRRPRRTSGRPAAPTASLRRSSGCSAPANDTRRGDRRHHGDGRTRPRPRRPRRHAVRRPRGGAATTSRPSRGPLRPARR